MSLLIHISTFKDGWSAWDEWTTCPVTCGTGVRIRQRHCLADAKVEMKGKSTCKGTEKQKQVTSSFHLNFEFNVFLKKKIEGGTHSKLKLGVDEFDT